MHKQKFVCFYFSTKPIFERSVQGLYYKGTDYRSAAADSIKTSEIDGKSTVCEVTDEICRRLRQLVLPKCEFPMNLYRYSLTKLAFPFTLNMKKDGIVTANAGKT
jgi:hypothetical protein